MRRCVEGTYETAVRTGHRLHTRQQDKEERHRSLVLLYVRESAGRRCVAVSR
jgi:hypothetical protein